MNLVPNKQLLLNVPFQSTKYRKKELCVDNKVRETVVDVFYPTCRNEKCVYISTNRMTTFYDCKKLSTFWIFFSRTKKRQLCCLAVTVHIVLQGRRVATTKKEIHLQFWRNFSANHNQVHPNLKSRSFSNYGIIVPTPHWLTQLTKTSFTFSFYTLSV